MPRITDCKKFVLLQQFFCGGCKNCCYMLHIAAFLGPLLYIGSIAAFFGTTIIDIVFCSILQRQDIKPSQYICFSSSNLDIAIGHKPTTINISFCIDTIMVVEKNAAICELQRRLYDRRNRDSFLRRFFLVIVVCWTTTIDL